MITSLKEYMSLVEHPAIDSRRAAVLDEADAPTWHAILDARPDLSSDVAMNKKLPTAIVDRLIATGCSRTRAFIALKRSLSQQQLLKLSCDEDDSVRALIANNRKTPRAILEQLLHDESQIVSEAASKQLGNHGDGF